jgi:hypothetical protein
VEKELRFLSYEQKQKKHVNHRGHRVHRGKDKDRLWVRKSVWPFVGVAVDWLSSAAKLR